MKRYNKQNEMIQNNLQNRNRLINLQNDLVAAAGKDRRRGKYGVWEGHVHTAIFKVNNQQGPIV